MAKAAVLHDGLTARRKQILQAIADSVEVYGFPPTVREIQAICGLASPSTVHDHMRVLWRDGYVTWREDSPRTFALTVKARQALYGAL